jgi:hypothetical protein
MRDDITRALKSQNGWISGSDLAALVGCSTSSISNFAKLYPRRVDVQRSGRSGILYRAKQRSETAEVDVEPISEPAAMTGVVTPRPAVEGAAAFLEYVNELEQDNTQMRIMLQRIRDILSE